MAPALGVPTRYFSDGAAESDGQYNRPSGSHYENASNAHVVVRAAISINARQHKQGYQAADRVSFEPRHHDTFEGSALVAPHVLSVHPLHSQVPDFVIRRA